MEVVIEEVFDKMISETLFKKDTWISKILKKIKCRSSCFCSLEPDEIIEKKNKQKEQVMEFIKLLKRQSQSNLNKIEEVKDYNIILETEI